MRKHKKSDRPSVGAPGRSEGSGACDASSDPVTQSITPAPGGQRISDYLLSGQENAIPLKQLKAILHLDGRAVRLMIRRERLAGVPILADNQTGYYLPANDYERARCVQSMKRRAAEIIKTANAIKEACVWL